MAGAGRAGVVHLSVRPMVSGTEIEAFLNIFGLFCPASLIDRMGY
jgi:hypothetical protein